MYDCVTIRVTEPADAETALAVSAALSAADSMTVTSAQQVLHADSGLM